MRGAIASLELRALPPFPVALLEGQVELRVRAVGLNFRDVLNVLGQYPGDPGPPGGDCAGLADVVGSAVRHLPQHSSAFGVALDSTPLASTARTDSRLLGRLSPALGFEGASTLPTVWATMHKALEHTQLHSGQGALLQAAAGGVGLTGMEYFHWLRLNGLGTAGMPRKHHTVRAWGVDRRASSRSSTAYAYGAGQLRARSCCSFGLSSPSRDFIPATIAILGEASCFAEIGKLRVWSPHRIQASASTACRTQRPGLVRPHPIRSDRIGSLTVRLRYAVLAIDSTMANEPGWIQAILHTVSRRAAGAALHALPSRSFDMTVQHQAAFRLLQRGDNTGKVVLRLTHVAFSAFGTHAITGGTGGIGIVTARWLSKQGASHLVLASHRGSSSTAGSVGAQPWGIVQCDASHVQDVQRLLWTLHPAVSEQGLQPASRSCRPMSRHLGLWHAAGILLDNLLQKQAAGDLHRVFGPKACGSWWMHLGCVATPLVAFVSFSSSAALIGGAGQANYAAANACLDGLAAGRRVSGRNALSVQWGPWGGVGMASSKAVTRRLESIGITPILPALGVVAMEVLLHSYMPPVACFMPASWERLLPSLLGGVEAVPGFYAAFAPRAPPEGHQSRPVTSTLDLSGMVGIINRTAGSSVDADALLMEAGVDSLGADGVCVK